MKQSCKPGKIDLANKIENVLTYNFALLATPFTVPSFSFQGDEALTLKPHNFFLNSFNLRCRNECLMHMRV